MSEEVKQETVQEPKPEYQAENATSGVPKNFVIRCGHCRWARLSSGVSEDLQDLHEIKGNCPTCGKNRRFKCPTCGGQAKMTRFKGNAVKTEK